MPRYLLYARKSTESEDRQVLSIDSQIRELREFAQRQRLEIVSVLSESRSAKAPGREVFGQVLKLINRGRADGLLCWKLDRLARNPVDGGALIWALDRGQLHEIATPTNRYVNTGNDKFMMQIEFGTAKKYVDDLSDNVRRGIRAKLELGWRPGAAPVGYRNDTEDHTIVPDPDRFALIRKIWDLVLAGGSAIEATRIANEEWGFLTRRTKRQGGRPLSRGVVYKLLSSPFYCGLIVHGDETFPGAHQAMVSREEFDRVQELLGRPNRAHQQEHRFAFTGLIRCGECGFMVTAEHKVNRYGRRYTYYHCSKRGGSGHCGQKTIRIERLEDQIREALGRIRITDRYREWIRSHLQQVHARERTGRETADRSLDVAYRDAQKRIAELLDLRLRGLVTDEEYRVKKQALVTEELRLKERLQDTDARAGKWLELCERALSFANTALGRFENGTLDEKRAILVAFGSNLSLRGRILRIELKEPFLWMEEGPHKLSGLAFVDGIRTCFQEHPDSIAWPEFCTATTRPNRTGARRP